MIWVAVGLGAWLVGAGLAWAFVAGAARGPEPFRRLDDLADLSRCA